MKQIFFTILGQMRNFQVWVDIQRHLIKYMSKIFVILVSVTGDIVFHHLCNQFFFVIFFNLHFVIFA